MACAEPDALAPLPMVEELRTLFSRAGTSGEIELYPGVHRSAIELRENSAYRI